MEARQLHLGGFIGDGTGEATCMGEKVRVWEGAVEMLEGVAHRHS